MSRQSLQWSVFHANLDPGQGSEQAGTRPVLVVSREVINQELPIVAVLPLTTARSGRRVYSSEVLVPAGVAGLRARSIIMAHQVRTISTHRLGKRVGELEDPALRSATRRALALYLDLD
jgi:mRNA interferase MazF